MVVPHAGICTIAHKHIDDSHDPEHGYGMQRCSSCVVREVEVRASPDEAVDDIQYLCLDMLPSPKSEVTRNRRVERRESSLILEIDIRPRLDKQSNG